ncbi:hypothetical protein NHX12_019211 [Muraenolepis orangiensis]|uniref:Uncharacterized protein n=1 Tax=Muraenolepis orangiensis TaxID=630683 RepID=A0A9Q0IVU9_9TELE|nr:hypothetical protein NHX12_019211 [Muraenolepis orangiensis]
MSSFKRAWRRSRTVFSSRRAWSSRTMSSPKEGVGSCCPLEEHGGAGHVLPLEKEQDHVLLCRSMEEQQRSLRSPLEEHGEEDRRRSKL